MLILISSKKNKRKKKSILSNIADSFQFEDFLLLVCLFSVLLLLFLMSLPQISIFSRFCKRLYSKTKGIDRICSVKSRRSCVAWLTGPRLRVVTLQWSVDNNSMKVRDSFPYYNEDIFLRIFPSLHNCRDQRRLNALPILDWSFDN